MVGKSIVAEKKTLLDEFTDLGTRKKEGLGFSLEPGPLKKGSRVTFLFNGPAKEAGLLVDDKIEKIDGKDLSEFDRESLGEYVRSREEEIEHFWWCSMIRRLGCKSWRT